MATLLSRCLEAYDDSDAVHWGQVCGISAVIKYLAQELHRQGHWQAAVFLADYEAQLEDENTTADGGSDD